MGKFTRREGLESFQYGIVYKRVGFQRIFAALSKQNAEFIHNFLQEQVKLGGQWEVAISEISHPSLYQNVKEGKIMFFDDKLSKTTEAYYFEPGLYSSITDILEATSTLIQKKKQPQRHFYHN